MAISAMSIYVLGIFYMFQELDLSKVEQWQFAITALPFWLILMLIPVALITFITTRNTRY
jgi:biotin transporter BioY